MAKKSVLERDKKRRNLVQNFLEKRAELKLNLKKAIGFYEKLEISFSLQKMPRNSSRVRLRNRCEITGRSRGFYRFFRLSRGQIRAMACKSFLPGVHKSSW